MSPVLRAFTAFRIAAVYSGWPAMDGLSAEDQAAIQAALADLGEEDPTAGVLVYPKESCPHLPETVLVPDFLDLRRQGKKSITPYLACTVCGEDEVCVCGQCGALLCSRGKNGHMAKHAEAEGHTLSLAMADLSFWCYKCDSYLDAYKIPELHELYTAAHVFKFGYKPCLPSG